MTTITITIGKKVSSSMLFLAQYFENITVKAISVSAAHTDDATNSEAEFDFGHDIAATDTDVQGQTPACVEDEVTATDSITATSISANTSNVTGSGNAQVLISIPAIGSQGQAPIATLAATGQTLVITPAAGSQGQGQGQAPVITPAAGGQGQPPSPVVVAPPATVSSSSQWMW
ncbi:hypothetical protein GYMLUDRAFT_253245 [Collybiopsis luxurians FD-317 M1]|uniref:Uncharacterized protein n=1 Tax=Collybiopsis luxurians FD-317 M1 TaxID=944289 RepID=A0A0D0BXB7_9AGAR|nr:hypothetical protein GYMLUDRAFT_253245 [Collybiopsis luxurians FD-317 M1]